MDRTPDPVLSPRQFGLSFEAFRDAAVAAPVPPTSPLLDRVAAHRGAGPAPLALVAVPLTPSLRCHLR